MDKSWFKLKVTWQESVLLVPLILLGAVFMGADIMAPGLGQLQFLGISYPAWLNHAFWLAPAAMGVVWLSLMWKWRRTAALIAIFGIGPLMAFIGNNIESRMARIPVKRWLEIDQLKLIEAKVGVPVSETGNRDGDFVIVAPPCRDRVEAELRQLDLLGPTSRPGTAE